MRTQRFRVKPGMLEELLDLGYDAELDGDEVVVYLKTRSKKSKKPKKGDKAEKWSKRERNFGYTRGQ